MDKFIPGFETFEQARMAGAKFYARMDGTPGREGRSFHLVKNEHRRWHFVEGPKPVFASSSRSADTREG